MPAQAGIHDFAPGVRKKAVDGRVSPPRGGGPAMTGRFMGYISYILASVKNFYL